MKFVRTQVAFSAQADASPQRLASMCANAVPACMATAWIGVSAPGSTPAGIVDRLNREINAAFADPKTIARIAELGAAPLAGSTADYAALVARDTEKWGKVVALSGATVQ
jgi:tripartite-type tricarboxylate transporter receptor subunit TctC